MCPMCIGTATTLVLSGSGAAGGLAFALGYFMRKKSEFRKPSFPLFPSFLLRRKRTP